MSPRSLFRPSVVSSVVLCCLVVGCAQRTAVVTPEASDSSNDQVSAPAETAAAPAVEPMIDIRAEEQVRRMTEHLKGLKRFRFDVDVAADDYLVEDEIVQRHRRVTVDAQRPERLRSTVRADGDERVYWFDGANLTFLDRRNAIYSKVPVSGTIDTLLNTLADKYDVVVPVMEFLSADSYRWLMGGVTDAEYVRTVRLGDEECHHLAFRQPTLDWQIWISADGEPLPRRLVIRYKDLPGNPQYQAVFSRWETGSSLGDGEFHVDVPADAMEVEFQPRRPAVGSGTRPE